MIAKKTRYSTFNEEKRENLFQLFLEKKISKLLFFFFSNKAIGNMITHQNISYFIVKF